MNVVLFGFDDKKSNMKHTTRQSRAYRKTLFYVSY